MRQARNAQRKAHGIYGMNLLHLPFGRALVPLWRSSGVQDQVAYIVAYARVL